MMVTATKEYDETHTVIAIYRYRAAVKQAIQALYDAGIGRSNLSVVGIAGRDETRGGGWQTKAPALHWLENVDLEDPLWEGLTGKMILAIPGFGRMAAAGPMALALEAGLESDCSFGGLTALGVVLYALGIPKDRAHRYEVFLMTGGYLLLVRGSHPETVLAGWRLNGTEAEEICEYGMDAIEIQ